MRKLLPLALALALAGCAGVPVTSPRFSFAKKPLEIPLGVVALPFALAGDMLLSWFILGTPFHWSEGAFSLLNPFCAVFDARPSDVDFLDDGVVVKHPVRCWQFDMKSKYVAGAARLHLRTSGFELASHGTDFETRWKQRGDHFERVVARTWQLRRGTRIALTLEVARSVAELSKASSPEEDARGRQLSSEIESLERESTGIGLSRAVEYHLSGKKGQERIEREVEAERAPVEDAIADRKSEKLDLDDEIYAREREQTRAALERVPEQVLDDLHDALAGRFSSR